MSPALHRAPTRPALRRRASNRRPRRSARRPTVCARRSTSSSRRSAPRRPQRVRRRSHRSRRLLCYRSSLLESGLELTPQGLLWRCVSNATGDSACRRICRKCRMIGSRSGFAAAP
jgi:hypothetical protein